MNVNLGGPPGTQWNVVGVLNLGCVSTGDEDGYGMTMGDEDGCDMTHD